MLYDRRGIILPFVPCNRRGIILSSPVSFVSCLFSFPCNRGVSIFVWSMSPTSLLSPLIGITRLLPCSVSFTSLPFPSIEEVLLLPLRCPLPPNLLFVPCNRRSVILASLLFCVSHLPSVPYNRRGIILASPVFHFSKFPSILAL